MRAALQRALLPLLSALALMVVGALTAAPAQAHQASDAYLQVRADARQVQVCWDVALADLDAVLPVDADGDRQLTWGELRRAMPQVEATLLRHLRIAGCPLRPVGHALQRRGEVGYLVLELAADCAPPPGLGLQYDWMAGVDATHRVLVSVRHPDGRSEARVLEPQVAAAAAGAGPDDPSTASAGSHGETSFVLEGMRHMLTGYDHLLFLLCLLLPVVLRREDGRWTPVPRWQQAAVSAASTVTLFTLAHSITLALAAFGHVRLPSEWVEPAIAISIGVAALDNLRPRFGAWRPAVTFVFGLLHGLGFAGVLQEIELPAQTLALALLQFNVGLELAQLAVVLVAVPVLAGLRRSRLYRPVMLHAGSLAAIAVATVWLVERVAPSALA